MRYRFPPTFCGLLLVGSAALAADPVAQVHWHDARQTIDGFGVSCAFNNFSGSPDSEFDLAFNATTGIGLTLLRDRVGPGIPAYTWEWGYMTKAQARGARLWSTVWSPPAIWKDNNDVNNGGHLLRANYADYAAWLVAHVQAMKARGLPLYGLSFQNEPTTNVAYESCLWTGNDFRDFVRDHLGPAMAAARLDTRIILPETENYTLLHSLADPTIADADALAHVAIIGTHDYSSKSWFRFDAAINAGKRIWQTESAELGTAYNGSIDNGVSVAQRIHGNLTIADASAWHAWWWRGGSFNGGSDNSGLLKQDGSEVPKRLWCVGNYARFIRPGWIRMGATTTPTTNVSVSAFRAPGSGTFAVVAINANSSAKTVELRFDGAVAGGTLTPWLTSASADLALQGTVVAGATATVSLPAKSVMTLVGSATPTVEAPFSGTPVAIPGRIEAEDYNLGGEGLAYHDLDEANQGGAYRSDGVDIEACTDAGGGFDVGYLQAGEWLAYTIAATGSRQYDLSCRVASSGVGGTIHLELDGVPVSGSLTIPDTGGWQTWADLAVPPVIIADGEHRLVLVADSVGGSGYAGNLNRIEVTARNRPPVASITAPASGSVVRAPAVVTVAATASDPDADGLAGLDLELDGVVAASATVAANATTASFAWGWGADPGTHALVAIARDPAGVAVRSATVAVVVQPPNRAPTAIPEGDLGAFPAGASIPLTAAGLATLLAVQDLDGDPLTYRLTALAGGWSGGATGEVVLTAGGLTWLPEATTPGRSGIILVRISDGYGGSTTASLMATLLPVVPVITSPGTQTGRIGVAFSRAMVATPTPAWWRATGLPAGLVIDPGTGVISGTPTVSGRFTATIEAGNDGGIGSRTVTFDLLDPLPVITSPATALGTVGQPFLYQITASATPYAYGYGTLPAGLFGSYSTGLISGTPTAAGSVTVTLAVSSAAGSGSGSVVITIAPAGSGGDGGGTSGGGGSTGGDDGDGGGCGAGSVLALLTSLSLLVRRRRG